MKSKPILSKVMFSFGVLLLLLAVLSAISAISAFLERSRFGQGLLFADAEFFSIITIILVILAASLLFISKKISDKTKSSDNYK
jgi:hypothetical protein